MRGPHEDAEAAAFCSTRLLAKVDTLVASTDVPPGMSLREAARKAVVACVSDFAAKGARPRLALVSVTLPPRTTRPQVRQLASGLAGAASEFGMAFLGGDTNGGEGLSITVCAMGEAPRRVPRRSGARAGDIVMATGPFGHAAAGLAIATSRRRLAATVRFAAAARRALVRPTPPLRFCAGAAHLFTASMDSSDGLAATLWEIASQGRVRIEVDAAPVGGGVREFAAENGLDAMGLVLYGGEEYETVFACRASSRPALRRRAARLGVNLLEIGRVARGRGVYLADSGRRSRVRNAGWRHLSA
ncbi:MAG: thiamine-phosphate kinase [Thaumarchaeota archaeon]|nr:thiamine-phosphate kinase [Nitrososphaerota archaeon]